MPFWVSCTASYITTIDSPYNSVTRAGSQCPDAERLDRAVQAGPFGLDSDVVLDEAEGEQDDEGDADGDEEGVCNILHGEVRDHRDETACKGLCQSTLAAEDGTETARKPTDEVRQSHGCS